MSLKVRSVYFNPEENSCLNACVLLRSESIEATPNPFVEFSFAKGLANVSKFRKRDMFSRSKV